MIRAYSPSAYELHAANISRAGVPQLTAGQMERFAAIAATTDLCPECGALKRVGFEVCAACESYKELIESPFGSSVGAETH